MDDKLVGFENLKISAFSKYAKLNGNVHNVTIGPNSVIKQSSPPKTPTEKPKPKRPQENKPDTKKNVSPSSLVPLKQIVKDLEAQRQEKVEEAIKSRVNRFEEFSKSHEPNQWVVQQQAFIDSMQRQEQNIILAIEKHSNCSKSAAEHNEKLVRHYQDMIQKQMHLEEQIEKNKERQRILHGNIESIMKSQLEFRAVYEEILQTITSCSSKEELNTHLGPDFSLLKTLPKNMDDIISKTKTYNIGEEEVKRAVQLLDRLKALKSQIIGLVTNINKKKEQEQQQKQQEESVENQRKLEKARSLELNLNADSLGQCISDSNWKRYDEIRQFFENYPERYREFVVAENLTNFRADLKKAVNIPVNAISAVSQEHLRDKYTRIHTLLSAKSVRVADKVVSAVSHGPQGLAFCTDLLAKRFVLQGDLTFSSNPDAVFSYATIIVTLWNDFPEFGQLLLGYFYAQCPYLVPFYIPKTEELTTEEYYKSLGYQYPNGQIEKQDKFLKRMTGIMRLYFAILIAKPKRGQAKNPHNIKQAWRFLASILKLEPQMDITATAIHTCLETVGFEMEAVYGRQFKKLVNILRTEFMTRMKQIHEGGPVSRLELLLHEYNENGRFEKPKGVLPDNFW